MGKEVAVEGCTIEDTTGGGTVTIDSDPSEKVLADGSKVYFGPLSFSVSGSDGGGKIGDGNGQGSGTIDGTGTNICDADGNPAILVGDKVTITVNGTTTSGSSTTSSSGDITVEITDAGQAKVIAL